MIDFSSHRATATLRERVVVLAQTGTIMLALTGAGMSSASAIESVPMSGLRPEWLTLDVRPQDDLSGAANNGTGSIAPGDLVDTDRAIEEGLTRAAKSNAQAGTPRQRMGDLYASFMNENEVEQRGIAPLRPVLAEIDAIDDRRGLARWMGYAVSIGISVPIGLETAPFWGYGVADIIGFRGFSSSGPQRENRPPSNSQRTDMQHYVETLLTEIGDPNARTHAATAVSLQHQLDEASASTHAKAWPDPDPEKPDPGSFFVRAPGFDWPAFIEAAGIQSRLNRAWVEYPDELAAITQVVTQAPLEDMKAYLKVRVIENYIDALPQRFYEAYCVYHGQPIASRASRGQALVRKYLGEEVHQTFAPGRVTSEQRAYVTRMFRTIKDVARDHYQQATWISAERRQFLLTRLRDLSIKVGNQNPISYANYLVERDRLFGNMYRGGRIRYNRTLSKLDMHPIHYGNTGRSRGSYVPGVHYVVIPEFSVHGFRIHRDADEAVMYGQLGWVLGHEIFHAIGLFQSMPAQSVHPDEARYVDDLKNKITTQYTYSGNSTTSIAGDHTIDENEADVMGLQAAYLAYKRTLGARPSPTIEGHSAEQRFFLGFAQTLHSNVRNEAMWTPDDVRQIEYVPMGFRVNTAVRNISGFYDAFAVRPGDRLFLAPDQRIEF